MDINQIMDMARVMVKSGYFKGLSPEQIAVRIMRGQEVGIPPVASVMGLDDVRGKLGFAAHTLAAMVQRSGKYSYHIKETTEEKCVIEFFRADELIGESEFTWADAERAGLPKQNQQYDRYPKAMLYNRALAQGVRMYCPDVSLGVVYETSEIEDFTEDTQEESRPIPNMSETPTQKPQGEPMTDPQRKTLIGLLAKHGVRAGDKTNLITAIYPDGPDKREASDAISLLKDGGKLIGSWANAYTRMLTAQHQKSNQEVSLWMKEQFSTNNSATITGEQQKELIAWIAGDLDDIPEPEPAEAEATEEVEQSPEPTPGDWARAAKEVCETAGVSLEDLNTWLMDQYPGDDISDMTQLGASVYNDLINTNTVTIKDGVETMKQKASNG